MAKRRKTGSADEATLTEDELVEIVRTKAQRYLREPNVTSVGVGYRMKDGKPTNELTVQFTVEAKLGLETLAERGITPLPEEIELDNGVRIPVDVIQRSYQPHWREMPLPEADEQIDIESDDQNRLARRDPIVPGISIANVNDTAGTLGGIVFDVLNGTPYALSNWHVLHGAYGRIGDKIAQPGPADDSNVDVNVSGRLVRSHLGHAGDCAIASIVGREYSPEILGLGVIPTRIGKPEIGDKVVKSGRTTGVTYGIVVRIGAFFKINYGGTVGRVIVRGFEIGPDPQRPAQDGEISRPGDSGSLWLVNGSAADRGVVLGLHFAGETDPDPAAEVALACDISSVFERLKVTLTHPSRESATATVRSRNGRATSNGSRTRRPREARGRRRSS